jgi:DNA-binding beta-propeller fold protein YncE
LTPFRRIAVGAGLLGISLVCLLAASAAAITVFPPTITKGFGASSVPLFGTTSLSFNIHNPNNVFALSGISFTDNFPPGLLVATPNNESGGCGGTVTATPGSSSVSLSNGSLNGAGNCTISLNVIGTWGGVKNNSVTVSSSSATGTNTSMASLTVLPPPTRDRVYWTNGPGNEISFANLDGSGGGDLSTGAATVNDPSGTALDPAGGRIYWANFSGNKISYANLDGSGGGDLTTGSATVSGPSGVALDPVAGRIYWANFSNKISFANLDGSGGGDLPTGSATVNAPHGVTLDPLAGRIYWSSFNGGVGKISFAKLDGSGGGDLDTGTATNSSPVGVAIDPATNRIYWANQDVNKISFVKLDDSAVSGDLSTGTATVNTPVGVALDPATGRIYWANAFANKISFANLASSDSGDLSSVASGNGFPALLRAPSGSGAPTVSGGSTPGSVLSCSQGTWAPDVASSGFYRAPQGFSYQWLVNGAPIGGAVANSYTAASPGSYSCAVTASNAAGSAQQTSTGFAVSATGQRAAALKKCKKKHSKAKRRKCRKRANLLPV